MVSAKQLKFLTTLYTFTEMTKEKEEAMKKRVQILRTKNITEGLTFEELIEFQRLKSKLKILNIPV